MIREVVDGRRQAWAPVELSKGDGTLQTIYAVIDTGFNGHLTLPLVLIEQLGLPQDDVISLRLAGGFQRQGRTWNGVVLWHDRPQDIQVIESPGGPLLGTRLLAGSQLTAQFRNGGKVLLEEL